MNRKENEPARPLLLSMGGCVIIDANARTADIRKHCFRTIEEYYIKNVCAVHISAMRLIYIYCNKINGYYKLYKLYTVSKGHIYY